MPQKTKDLTLVKHDGFWLGYSEKHEQAGFTLHLLAAENTTGYATRSKKQFMDDHTVKTKSATWADYIGSGYDRGHLVPFADFKCCQAEADQTFYMSNICPQLADFNREIWSNLETRTRSWAKRHKKVWVFTGPVHQLNPEKIGRRYKISVPTAFYKIIVHVDANNQVRTLAFLLPHAALTNVLLSGYIVNIDEIETKTGINFMAKMPDNIENEIENQKGSWTEWNQERFN